MFRRATISTVLFLSACATQAERQYAMRFTLTTHGTSMLPAIQAGDTLHVERIPYEDLRAAQIAAFRSPYAWPQDLEVHRLQSREPNGWITKGDNNAQRDMFLMSPRTYVGVVKEKGGQP